MPSPCDSQTARFLEEERSIYQKKRKKEERSLYVVSLFESLQSLWFRLLVIFHVYNRRLSMDVKCVAFCSIGFKMIMFIQNNVNSMLTPPLASIILLNEVVIHSDINFPVS